MSRISHLAGLALPAACGVAVGLVAWSTLGATVHAATTSLPNLSITAPTNGSTVSGTVTLSASAADVGYSGLQFQVNGVNQGSEITSGPCSISWDTTGAPEGSYTISAIGRDDSGNVGLANSITVAVLNSAPQIFGVTAWNIGDTSASVTWSTNQSTDGEADYGTTTSYSASGSDSSMGTTHTVVLSNLTPGTLYHFQVRAANLIGMSSTTTDATFSTTGGASSSSPSAPAISAVATSNMGLSSALVSWTTDQATTGAVDFGTTQSYGSTINDANMTTSHSVFLSGLPSGSPIHYRVRSTNAQSLSSATGDLTFSTTSNPGSNAAQISAITTWDITSSSASITWTTDQATTGSVDFGTSSSYGLVAVAAGMATTHTVTLTGLVPSTTYHFRIQATTAQNQSSATADTMFATALPGSPNPAPPATPPSNSAGNLKPSVTVTSPLLNTTYGVPAKVMLAASASDLDGTISSVSFYVNGALVGTRTSAPYAMSWVGWSAGTYSVTATATDNSGATTQSAAVTFSVLDQSRSISGSPISQSAPAGGCQGADPFAAIGGGDCVAGTFVPPGYTPSSTTGAQTAQMSMDGGASSGGCTTGDPYSSLGGGVCIGGGWLPPGAATPQKGRGDTANAPSSCTTSDPFSGIRGLIGVCVNGSWVPAISGKSGG